MNVEKPFLILCIAIGLLTSCGNETYGDELAPQTYTATWPCENGMADIYPCNGYDLMSYMSLQDLTPGTSAGSLSGNDSWGWTDPTTNKEYALVGLNSHAAFVDISNPVAPLLIGVLPTATVNSSWRDIKVYQDHAFIVSEAPGRDNMAGAWITSRTGNIIINITRRWYKTSNS